MAWWFVAGWLAGGGAVHWLEAGALPACDARRARWESLAMSCEHTLSKARDALEVGVPALEACLRHMGVDVIDGEPLTVGVVR